MPKKIRRSGRWLTLWVPGRQMWVFRALERVIRRFEEKGVPKSRSELALGAIQAALKEAFDHDPGLRADAKELVLEED
jgi:hypothetical protein